MHSKEKGKMPAEKDRQEQWLSCFLFLNWERKDPTGFDMLLLLHQCYDLCSDLCITSVLVCMDQSPGLIQFLLRLFF